MSIPGEFDQSFDQAGSGRVSRATDVDVFIFICKNCCDHFVAELSAAISSPNFRQVLILDACRSKPREKAFRKTPGRFLFGPTTDDELTVTIDCDGSLTRHK